MWMFKNPNQAKKLLTPFMCISKWLLSDKEIAILVVLPTGLNSRVGSGYGSARNLTVVTGLTTRKTRTIGHGPVFPPKTQHFKITILPPFKYLSSDRIMTWLVCRLFRFSRSFTSRCQIGDRTNTNCVAIENPPIWRKISPYFTANQRILVRLQI